MLSSISIGIIDMILGPVKGICFFFAKSPPASRINAKPLRNKGVKNIRSGERSPPGYLAGIPGDFAQQEIQAVAWAGAAPASDMIS